MGAVKFRLLLLALAAALSACSPEPDVSAADFYAEHADERKAAVAELESHLVAFQELGQRVGNSRRYECRLGQHNWKIDDGYDVTCSVSVSQAIRLDGDSFRAVADRVHAQSSCDPEGEALPVMRDYWDTYRGKRTHAFEGPYIPDYLPGYSLGCNDVEVRVAGWSTLPVTGKDAIVQQENSMGRPCSEHGDEHVCQLEGSTAPDVWADIPEASGWIVYLTAEKQYAQR